METRRLRTALLLAVILAAAGATASEFEIYLDQARPMGSLSRVVEPTYPKALLSAGKGGYVDIAGTVTHRGELENVKYTPDSPSSQAFVAPLREVIPYWKFHTDLDDDCRPVFKEVTARMFFEVVEGKPKVSVTHAVQEKSPPELRPVKFVQPEYPRRARIRIHEAVVYAAADITQEGKVASMQFWVYPENASRFIFTDVTKESLAQWEFPAATGDRKRRVCLEFEYKLVD